MTQFSLTRGSKGIKRTIKVPGIAAGSIKQYNKEEDKFKAVLRRYGAFNQITVLNNDAVNIEIALDYAEEKTYPVPASSSLSLDEVIFQELNIVNLDAVDAVAANKITIICAYEHPLIREEAKGRSR